MNDEQDDLYPAVAVFVAVAFCVVGALVYLISKAVL